MYMVQSILLHKSVLCDWILVQMNFFSSYRWLYIYIQLKILWQFMLSVNCIKCLPFSSLLLVSWMNSHTNFCPSFKFCTEDLPSMPFTNVHVALHTWILTYMRTHAPFSSVYHGQKTNSLLHVRENVPSMLGVTNVISQRRFLCF